MRISWRVIFLGTLVVLLFVGGIDNNSHRVYRQIWDTGHIVLFAGLIWSLLILPMLAKRRWLVLFVFTSGFCLFVGFSIEVLQLIVGRDFSLQDIVNDVLGGYLGLFIFTAQQVHRKPMLRITMIPLMLGIVAWVLVPIYFAVLDKDTMQKDFPILADFESDYELGRWEHNLASISMAHNIVRHGKRSMRIDLYEGKYPGIVLRDFSQNWREFSTLEFSVFNTLSKNITIRLKIYDWQHDRDDYQYLDRFNTRLTLKPGWNDFSIPLDEVESAPENRQMNLADIAGFNLFLYKLKQPVTLYFDNLRLTNQ